MNFNIGDTMGGYEIVGVLGSGGMGEVYRVRNVISDRVDAMKVLLANLQRDDDFATRFLREIKVQARLVHPNIAQLYTAFEYDGNLMMIMELIDGLSLLEMLQRGRIPLPQVIDYTQQALTALSYAHVQGVIHRDIKPGNIMVTRSGSVKLMDFGIAKAATDRSLTITGNLIGSLYYMSPEQVKAVAIDSRSDLYSVGIVLYQMATGKKPFDGDSEYRIMRAQVEEPPPPPTSIEPSVPEELSNVILRALAKDPAERFQTGEEFREALGRVAGMLRDVEGGATRMLGSYGVPMRGAQETPTAPLADASASARPSPAAPPPGRVSAESVPRQEMRRAPAAPKTPVQPPAQAAATGPRDTLRAVEESIESEERPERSRTPLWIAAGMAAAVLIVAATQIFDWMSTGSPERASSESTGQVVPPVDSGQPPVSQPNAESPAAASSATPSLAQPPQDRSQQETASPPPRTPAATPPSGGTAPRKGTADSSRSPQPATGAVVERTAPPPTNPAPATSNPEPVRSEPVSTPPAGSASPAASPTQLQASAGGGRSPASGTASSGPASSGTTATKSVPPAAPAASNSPQQATPAGGQTAAPSPAPAQVPSTPPPAVDRVYLPNEVDSLPDVLHRVQPRYSAAAAQVRAEGVVRLETEIWPDGETHNIRIVQSAGHADLDRNAVEALRKWNFVPGRKDGSAVKVRARIDFPFSLQTTSQRPALSKDR